MTVQIRARGWRLAMNIAALAMGPKQVEEDPLAWWCLTELIHGRRQRFGVTQSKLET